jgi:hypothetical protein
MDAPTDFVLPLEVQQITYNEWRNNNPNNDETNSRRHEEGPTYKNQCQGFTPASNLSSTLAELSPDGTVHCSSTSTTSPSMIDNTYIPLVCGVPLYDEQNNNELHELQQVHVAIASPGLIHSIQTVNVMRTSSFSPEQAPVPSTIAINRDNDNKIPSTLTKAEKRYWVKVVLIAIVVNTILVMAVVMGGICGISGCNLSNHEIALDNNQSPNSTEVPTPSPSRRRIWSDNPSVSVVASPTYYDADTTMVPSGSIPKSEVAAPPSEFPSYTMRPTLSPTMNDSFSTEKGGVNMIVVIPVAIVVDAILIVSYLFYHYRRRNKVHHCNE